MKMKVGGGLFEAVTVAMPHLYAWLQPLMRNQKTPLRDTQTRRAQRENKKSKESESEEDEGVRTHAQRVRRSQQGAAGSLCLIMRQVSISASRCHHRRPAAEMVGGEWRSEGVRTTTLSRKTR